jgi:hypothetical protein
VRDKEELSATRAKIDVPDERNVRGSQSALSAHGNRAQGAVQRDAETHRSRRMNSDHGRFVRGHPSHDHSIDTARVELRGAAEARRAGARLERSHVERATAQSRASPHARAARRRRRERGQAGLPARNIDEGAERESAIGSVRV